MVVGLNGYRIYPWCDTQPKRNSCDELPPAEALLALKYSVYLGSD